jgi:LPPG:FO 2-phospho-L-lactate transferase
VTVGPAVAVVCGGVGAARLLRGIVRVVDAAEVTAIVNTGDDTELHGLHIAPDLDTITYTLAEAIDTERGWGLAGETWNAMTALDRYARVRPPGSLAAPTWFNLGDRDLATHLFRTARLGEGATLTEVTAEITRAWGLDVSLLPMTDDRLRTMVTVAGHGEIGFQDYFVRLRHDVDVEAVRFVHDDAALSAPARTAIETADVVVIAPSNPIVSIGPIRALRGVDELLAERRESVVAVSPIVGGAALKGPADRMLDGLGHESSVVGVAELYRSIAATLVIDPADEPLAAAVEATGMRCVVTPSVMTTLEVATDLASTTLAAGRSGAAPRS